MISADAAPSDRPAVKRGTLRIYLGAAPGVGKTYAMLNEGRRRRDRGTDVIVGLVETHSRARTAEQIGDLEVAPRRTVEHRGATITEMDAEAILRRRPEVVLVDELAHTNAPGSRHAKRWEDIHDLLAAGIDVVSTVNIQHLESLNDVVEGITGIQQRETVPDEVVRAADQIELVDMDPDALRRRMAHGNVYAADRIDAALANYFRSGNLTALRELALLWVANRVDDELADYRARHGISRPWETRERVVVALSGAAGADHLLRRASRIAQRAKGELIGVHVVSDSGLSTDQPTVDIGVQRRLLEELGGEYRKIVGSDVAGALVDLARAENATQIVLGASARSRWHELFHGSIINRVVRRSGPIDVHVISPPASGEDEARRLPAMRRVLTPLPPRRQLAGWLIAALGLPAITLAFIGARDTFGLTSVLLLYLVLAMVVALVGGVFPAAFAVIGGFLLANWFFAPPYGQLDIAHAENALALSVYFVAAGIVAVLVDRIGRSRLRAVRAQAEAETLAALVGTLARPGASRDMLDELRMTFGLRGVSLLRRDEGEWRVMLSSGTAVVDPAQATWSRELGDGVALALDGETASADDLRVLDAFATQVAAAAERDRLRAEAAKADDLAAANALRDSLLQAVSHDLRTPLASIKASISSLRQRDVDWPPDVVVDFEETIESETDRLTVLIGNLLDMSRLQASTLSVDRRPTGVDEVVLSAVASLGAAGRAVDVDVAADLAVSADPAMLERALANVISNATRFESAGGIVLVTAGAVRRDARRLVDVRVIDHGPGIRSADRERVFQPFQRVVDHGGDGSGVGLGLAIARGFVEAMGGEVTIEDTPGGGTTMVLSLDEDPGAPP